MDAMCDLMLIVLGRWRLEEGEEILDLADYAHVPDGPGVILVSHRWHFGIDWAAGKPGLWYSSRKGLTGTVAERISQAVRGLLEKGNRLLAEKEIPSSVRPLSGDLEITFNDRLRYPNTPESDAQARPALQEVLTRLYGKAGFQVAGETDPGRRLGYRVRAAAVNSLSLEELARNL